MQMLVVVSKLVIAMNSLKDAFSALFVPSGKRGFKCRMSDCTPLSLPAFYSNQTARLIGTQSHDCAFASILAEAPGVDLAVRYRH